MDEPFSGLDPVNSQILKEVVQEQIQKGKLVIFSSHQMNYVEEFCEDIIILHHGDVVLQGNVKQLKKEYGKNRIVLRAGIPEHEFSSFLKQECSQILHVYKQNGNEFIVELENHIERKDVLKKMMEHDIELEAFYLYEASLTDIFVDKAGDDK